MKTSHEMVLDSPNARITGVKLSKEKPKGDVETPVIMTLAIETAPTDIHSLTFLVPDAMNLALWDRDGELLDKAPEKIKMGYKTGLPHHSVIDETYEFEASHYAGFTIEPVLNMQVLLSFTGLVIEPEQHLVTAISSRIKAPINFKVSGEVPDDQADFGFE